MAKAKEPFTLFLVSVTGIGFILLVVGLLTVPTISNSLNFFLFLFLGTLTGVATTSTAVSDKSGISYDLHNAVAMAAVPLFGIGAAVIIVAAANISMWLVKPADDTWQKSFRQLAFNVGMFAIAITCAGGVFFLIQSLFGAETFLGQTLPWAGAALVYGQVNVWILIVILYLQRGVKISPLSLWREQWWAVAIDGAVMGFGGAVLAYAATAFDWTGIVIFFLPIFLSAFAFRVYVNRTRAQLNNLEQIVSERTDELRTLLIEKDAFLAVLTHDMRTPLTTIGLYTDMLEKRPELLLERPYMLNHFSRSQKSLLEIVENILDLASFQTNQQLDLQETRLEIVPLVELQVESLMPQAEDKGITLAFEAREADLLVYADRIKLDRVLQNLISNALKYTGDGGQVIVNVRSVEDKVKISVKDNGFGIPAEELPHIFEPYRRVEKHKRLAVGTGLGLAITKALIEAHGGQIDVISQDGEGSTFTVTLPIRNR